MRQVVIACLTALFLNIQLLISSSIPQAFNSPSSTHSRSFQWIRYPVKRNSCDYTFSHLDRIKKKKEFDAVYENGDRCFSKQFLFILKKNELGRCRLGVTVTKKVDKRAVYRNKIKRRIREIFRLHRHLCTDNYDMVVVARKHAQECTYQDVRRQMLGALKHNGYLELPPKENKEKQVWETSTYPVSVSVIGTINDGFHLS